MYSLYGTRLLALITAALLLAPARAEVTASTPSGFVSEHTLRVAADPAQTWKALSDIGGWWQADHTYSGNAGNLSLEPQPGGCFCEQLPGGGVEHMRVVYAQPPAALRLTGGLGPLQEHAITGALTVVLTAAESGTQLQFTYRVGGYMPGGVDQWAAAVDGVLAAQVSGLKARAERRPAGATP